MSSTVSLTLPTAPAPNNLPLVILVGVDTTV